MPQDSGNFVDVKNGCLCEPWYVAIVENKFQRTENVNISHFIIVAKRHARQHERTTSAPYIIKNSVNLTDKSTPRKSSTI